MAETATPAAVPAAAAPAAAAASADDFDAVFAEITKAEDTSGKPDPAGAEPAPEPKVPVIPPKPAPVAEPEPVAAVAAPAAGVSDASDNATDAAAVAAAAAGTDPAAPVVATDAAKAAEPTELEKAQARVKELEDAAKKPPAAAESEAKTETPPVEIKIDWYKPTEPEVTAMAEYEKEWPQISAAEGIRTKAAVYNAVQYIFAEIAKTYGPQMDRFATMSDAIADSLTLQQIRGQHQDYDAVYDNVVAWVDTLPVFMKNGAKETMKSGTPEEVSQLVGEYKRLHPTSAVATPAAAETAAPAKTELSAAAKKAASKLTVVDSKRTAPVTAVDQSDFEGTWKEITAAG